MGWMTIPHDYSHAEKPWRDSIRLIFQGMVEPRESDYITVCQAKSCPFMSEYQATHDLIFLAGRSLINVNLHRKTQINIMDYKKI